MHTAHAELSDSGESRVDSPADRNIWRAVDRLIDRAPALEDLEAHGLHLLAARRWRELGRPVPEPLAAAELLANMLVLGATVALERVRSAYDGPILLLKGLELAARYPSPALRPLRDVDILVERPEAAQRALIDAGFEPIGYEDAYYASRHHLRPLRLPGLPALVEVHRRPEWVTWSPAPSAEELLSDAVPSATGIDGILAPAPSHHALMLAAHSWREVPLRRILDLLDIRLLERESDRALLAEAATRWQLDGVWSTTLAAAEAVIFGRASLPWHVRVWAKDLEVVRDRTVFINHVRRVASPFAALPPRRASAAALRALAREVTPAGGESWSAKAARTRRAFANAFRRVSTHDRDRSRT